MKDYCTCGFRRVDRAFLSAGLVYCSNCDKPVCCDTVRLDAEMEPHAAEIVHDEYFSCWRHSRERPDAVEEEMVAEETD